jgi:hypothetical protein
MNEFLEISYMLGRQRFEERLREAEAVRRLRIQPDGSDSLQRQLGRTLVRLGMFLAGPHPAQPVNGH